MSWTSEYNFYIVNYRNDGYSHFLKQSCKWLELKNNWMYRFGSFFKQGHVLSWRALLSNEVKMLYFQSTACMWSLFWSWLASKLRKQLNSYPTHAEPHEVVQACTPNAIYYHSNTETYNRSLFLPLWNRFFDFPIPTSFMDKKTMKFVLTCCKIYSCPKQKGFYLACRDKFYKIPHLFPNNTGALSSR